MSTTVVSSDAPTRFLRVKLFPRTRAAVSSEDDAILNRLNACANAIVKCGMPASGLFTVMAEYVKRVEKACCRKVICKDGSRDWQWFIFDQVGGLINVCRPNLVRLLHASIDGVTIQANLNKPGCYDHDNEYLARALRRLADAISGAPYRLADCDAATLQIDD
jgi:hypothetical protein